jgi:hypothetical protein
LQDDESDEELLAAAIRRVTHRERRLATNRTVSH